MSEIKTVGISVEAPLKGIVRSQSKPESDAPLPAESFVASALAPATSASETSNLVAETAVAEVAKEVSNAPVARATSAVPTTLALDFEDAPQISDEKGVSLTSGSYGPGFVAARPNKRTTAQLLHDFLAHRLTGPYSWAVTQLLERISSVTSKGVGVDVEGLLHVERTLYQGLTTSKDGYLGGAPPLFQSLAEGQAAYVNLGPERGSDSDHLMRMFAGLPLNTIDQMGLPKDDLGKVRSYLLERAKLGEFPVYVDMDQSFDEISPTESIATESIASIARRENQLGDDFPDPRMYYKWLVTRVESAFRRLDPWLFGIKPETHKSVEVIKDNLTPPWLDGQNADPFGYSPDPTKTQKAYGEFMKVCGSGQPPTFDTLVDIADTTVCLDRDLLSGIQTYWIKMLRASSHEQRESLMKPLARTWVTLNTTAPSDPNFERISPTNAPYIELIEKHSGKKVEERYDRAMAMAQAIDHMVDGFGIEERRLLVNTLMDEARSKKDELISRENRLRQALGPNYRGLDVQVILNGDKDISDPEVKAAIADLRKAAQPQGSGFVEMTTLHAEVIRHRDLMDWIAGRHVRYGDVAFEKLFKSSEYGEKPLILGEFYTPPVGPVEVTPLPPGPSRQEILGKPVEGKEPVKMSVVLEGGGGKGFAYVETLRQVRSALASGEGQVAIDEYAGNSAGAITAGLLAGGFNPDEMGEVLKRLDFKKFYSDYLWLSGGVDPKVRGIDRTGIFSMQKMYQTLSGLLKEKVPVEGRPVLFRDLPFKLSITSTLLNTDLSDEEKKRLGVGKDGQVVFSSENTPNMDVAAAICCSAAVPGFFNAPQVQLCQEVDRQGNLQLRRMQMVDGGTVNNYPIAEAGSDDEKSFLINMPTYYQAPPLTPGGKPIELSTLNFDSSQLAHIDAFNRERYKEFTPGLAPTVHNIASKGYDRVVLGLNLAKVDDEPAPIIQGRDRKETEALLTVADQSGLPHLSAKDGADKLIAGLNGKKHSYIEQILLNSLLDKDDTFHPGIFRKPGYTPQKREAQGLPDMIAGVMAANMTAPSQLEHRLFEKA